MFIPQKATLQEIFREKVKSFDQVKIFKKEDKYQDIIRKYFPCDNHLKRLLIFMRYGAMGG